MVNNNKSPFLFDDVAVFKKDSGLSTITQNVSFDDLADFSEERLKIQRKVEESLNTTLKVDFSNFSNHTFFGSAESKFAIAKDRMLDTYPFNGSSEEKDLFLLSGSGYEKHIHDTWPRHVGYLDLNSSQYISASDNDSKLFIGSSSFYVSAWVRPKISQQNIVLQHVSASLSPSVKHGYELIFSGATDLHVKFNVYSGSTVLSVSASYSASLTASFNNVAAIYDKTGGLLSLYINKDKKVSSSISLGPIEFLPSKFIVGSGSRFDSNLSNYNLYSGSLDEIRVLHTASSIFHEKNYSRPIYSEDYVKLNYRFNEGVVGNVSIDTGVVDYSKSGLHGLIVGYNSSTRLSGAAMYEDFGDPILYTAHSDIVSFTSSIENSASIYDKENKNIIFRMIPEEMLREDEEADGLLTSFSLAMARYFDDIKLYIDQFVNLKTTNYDNKDESPDLFLPFLKNYFGWRATDHFSDSNPLEFFFGENVLSSGSLDTPLVNIRDEFWRRILNNLPYLYKSKGKRSSLDAFFNILGINKNILSLKEYGFITRTSIEDERIYKQKPVAFLGIATSGSVTGSYVSVPGLLTGQAKNEYTIESYVQLPSASGSFSGTLLNGSVWEMVNPTQSEGFCLLWKINNLKDISGSFILTGSDGQVFSSSYVPVFDGNFVHLAAGLKSNGKPFIDVTTIDGNRLILTQSYVGSTNLSGVFTGSNYNFVMGSCSGSLFQKSAEGYFGEYRYWTRQLSSSEIQAHALHNESIGTQNPLELPSPLLGHWALNENRAAGSDGRIHHIPDLSRNRNVATGSLFENSFNPYKKFLFDYNHISPSIDLKWTENKIRVRDKTELVLDDISKDTNEVGLQFNLVDALNEDISKIFSTLDTLNNVVGAPINKYREDYTDLESYRRVYFDRLSDSLNFNKFFKLFRWFDKKISNAIRQLLPARVHFIGGEHVVESHFLERNKYQYKYTVFKTPKDINEGVMSASVSVSGNVMNSLEDKTPMMGTYPSTVFANDVKYIERGIIVPPRLASVVIDGQLQKNNFVSTFGDGDESVDRNKQNFFRLKVSGDTSDEINNPNVGVNFKNEFAKRQNDSLANRNFDGNYSGSFIHPSLGNGFVFSEVRTDPDNSHYFGGYKKFVRWVSRGFSASLNDTSGNEFSLAGAGLEGGVIELSQSVYDQNNVKLDTDFIGSVITTPLSSVTIKRNPRLIFRASGSNTTFNSSEFTVQFKDGNSAAWSSYRTINGLGLFFSESNKWMRFESNCILNGEIRNPEINFANTNVLWRISSSAGKTYAFKDFSLEFDQPLSDQGVLQYQKIDNQFGDFKYENYSIMPKTENSPLRENSYYGWENLNKFGKEFTNITDVQYRDLAIDSSGSFYIIGRLIEDQARYKWFVRKSVDGGKNWSFVDYFQNAQDNTTELPMSIAIDKDDKIYVVGKATRPDSASRAAWLIRASTDKGLTWSNIDFITGSANPGLQDFNGAIAIAIDVSGAIYVGGSVSDVSDKASWRIRKSTTGLSGSFSTIENIPPVAGNSYVQDIVIDPFDYKTVYALGREDSSNLAMLRKTTDSGSTWDTVHSGLRLSDNITVAYTKNASMTFDKNGQLYWIAPTATQGLFNLSASNTGASGSFRHVSAVTDLSVFGTKLFCDSQSNLLIFGKNDEVTKVVVKYLPSGSSAIATADLFSNEFNETLAPGMVGKIDKYDYIYSAFSTTSQQANDTNAAYFRRGKRGANSGSLGPRMLASSVGYVESELSGTTFSKFKLMNVSEFPHYGGLFQMPNLVLGTKDSGKVGKSNDSIVRVNYFGSVVKVMWPKQENVDAVIKGFGDLAPGQYPGKLTTRFVPGDFFDVTEYDHLSLWCYAKKEVSGTLDDIILKVSSRPLRSVGFAEDQLIEFSTSGSVVEGRLKDLVHPKQINYGDLSENEIGYILKIPLSNVRELQVSARQVNGQSDERNRNFIVWGRLIKSDEET